MMNKREEKVARAIALWVGYSGVLDTMPPSAPDDLVGNEEWLEINFRPFLAAATAAINATIDPL